MPQTPHRLNWKFAVLAACFVGGVCLTWYTVRGDPAYRTLLTMGYLILLFILLRTKIIQLPKKTEEPPVDGRSTRSDVGKGAGLMFGAAVWVPLMTSVVPDTPVGVAVVLVPFGALLLGGAFLLIRDLFRKLQQ